MQTSLPTQAADRPRSFTQLLRCGGLLLALLLALAPMRVFAEHGIYSSYVKTGGTFYYILDSGSGFTNFDGASLGTYNVGQNLTFNGGEINAYRYNGSTTTGANLYYVVYPTGSRPASPSFTTFVLPDAGSPGTNNEAYKTYGGTTNLLAGLGVGNYTVEIYGQDYGNFGSDYLNNNNSPTNYTATFTISAVPLNGTYTVGQPTAALLSPSYQTLTAAFADLAANGVSGPVTFSLINSTSTPYNVANGETFPLIITPFAGASATNRLTIKPAAGTTPSIVSSSAGGTGGGGSTIRLNRADYVTFDGSNTVGGITRDLTVTTTSTMASIPIIFLSSETFGSSSSGTSNTAAADGCTFITIKNLVIAGGDNNSTLGQKGILLFGATSGFEGSNHDDDQILNNLFYRLDSGIFGGADPNVLYDRLVIQDNVVGVDPTSVNASANSVSSYGFRLRSCPGMLLSHNTVLNVTTAGNSCRGIAILDYNDGAVIERNIVRGVVYTGTADRGAVGIVVVPPPAGYPATAPSKNLVIRNNAISGVVGGTASSTTAGTSNTGYYQLTFGIGILSGSGHQVYNNSVQLSADRIDNAYTGKTPAALYVADGVTGLDVRNNIFSNVQTSSDPDAAGLGTNYAVYAEGTASPFTTINYNLYDVRSGAAFRTTAVSPQYLGHLNGADYATLASWQVATTQDRSSMLTSGANTPGFTSALDLTPNPADAGSYSLNGTGVQLPASATDLNGGTHSTTVAAGAPDLGAYEVTPTATPNNLEVSGPPVLGGTQTFSFNGRPVASITYGPTTTGTFPTVVTAKYYPGVNPPSPTPGTARYYNAYFTLADASNSTGYTYTPTVNYDPALLGTIASESAQNISQQTNGHYTTYASTVNPTARTVTSGTPLTTFDLLTISDQAAPLPVSLTRFEAVRQDQQAALSWATASETDNAGFEVQVSTDGVAFRALGFVAASSPSSLTVRAYAFLDSEPGKAGTRYYRLRQQDLSGRSNYSGVRSVNFGGTAAITCAPNPFHEALTLNMLATAESCTAPLTLTDVLGRVVLHEVVTIPAGSSQLTLPSVAALPAGMYVLQLPYGGQLHTMKVLKQ